MQQLALREKVLALLLRRYGSQSMPPNNKLIYECAHDWVSQGHRTVNGLIAYYESYYGGGGTN